MPMGNRRIAFYASEHVSCVKAVALERSSLAPVITVHNMCVY